MKEIKSGRRIQAFLMTKTLKTRRLRLSAAIFCSLFFFTNKPVYCQIDTSFQQETKSVTIAKARAFLLDKFLEKDLQKVKEVKDYLKEKVEHEDYITLYPFEHWLILYWTKEYEKLSKEILNNQNNNLEAKVYPPNDMLFEKLLEKSISSGSIIKGEIEESSLDTPTKDFLILTFDYLISKEKENQLTLNIAADYYLNKHSGSKYDIFIKKYIREKFVPKSWGLGFEFFSGLGLFTGELSEKYTYNIPIGVAFDIEYKKLVIYLRDYIGFNKTKREILHSNGIWKKGANVRVFFPEASLGYNIFENEYLQISPFIGIGSMNISPTAYDIEKVPQLEELELNFTSTYLFGANLDFKLGKKTHNKYNPKTSFTFLRIRYSYSNPTFEKKYDSSSGIMHYITIGIGGFARGVKRLE